MGRLLRDLLVFALRGALSIGFLLPPNTVVMAGSYGFINGWGVSSGEANWSELRSEGPR